MLLLCSGSVQECHTATWATWKFCSTDSSASYKASGIYHLLHWWHTHFLNKLAPCWFSMMTCETKVTMWHVRVHEFVHFVFSWILVCLYICVCVYYFLCGLNACGLDSFIWFILFSQLVVLWQKQTKLAQDENQLLENILRTLLQELVVWFSLSFR